MTLTPTEHNRPDTQEKHEHQWNFIRTFIGEGKPVIKQQMIAPTIGSDEPTKVKTWTDCRQEYVLYHCVCGKKKEVEI